MQKGFRGFATGLLAAAVMLLGGQAHAQGRHVAYLAPSLAVSFWTYVAKGVEAGARDSGYGVTVLDSHNSDADQLRNAKQAIAGGVDGIMLSPTTSAAAPAVLALAAAAHIPVVICDIGTPSGTYASFIASDNLRGARGIGQATASVVKQHGWTSGSFGIIGIPQARKNGQLRSAGFRAAMQGTGLTREVALHEMKTFSAAESFGFAKDMLDGNADLHVIFVESDEQAIGAAAAVAAAHRQDSVVVAAFDGTPELLKAIGDGRIVGAGMQQPYLMGRTASERLGEAMGGGTPAKLEMVPILTVTGANVQQKMPQILLNVFANKVGS